MANDTTTDGESIQGKVVLVTGGATGLGAALVRAVAERRGRVVINCRTDQKRAESLALEVTRGGAEALVCRADVTDPEQARGLVEETIRVFGRVDVLVNTVGTFSWKPVAEIEPAEWRSVMASNLDSVYHMCRLVLPHMRKNRWGRIVNLGAVGAERAVGQPKCSAYSAAKSGVIAFSKSLALEEARCGITVNVVCPGVLVDGDPGAGPDQPATKLGDRAPVGFGSPAADFVTGQVLAVAGGWGL